MNTTCTDNHTDILLTWPADGLRLFESMQPLGLLSIGTFMEQSGYSTQIIDFNHYKKDFRLDLLRLKPKVVGIGGTTATRKASFYTARLVKEVLPETYVVYGGPHATFTATDTLAHVPEIDYVIQGEGEYSFLQLVKALTGTSAVPLASVPGLAWRENEEICVNKPERIQDINALPVPSRKLLENDYPITIDHTDTPTAILLTSRGCPALCDFCSASRLFPGGVRFRGIEQIEAEILQILEQDPTIKGVKIFDSTFTASREHVENFCRMIRPYNLVWECEVRADTVTFDLLETMRDAGCIYINIGLESSSERALKRMGKSIKSQDVENVLNWCKDLKIMTKVFFTFGHLDQSVNEIENDIDYMLSLKDRITFFATTVGIRIYPGTILERKLQKRGYFPADFSWAKHKPSLRNYLVFEPADVMILEQPKLSLWKLARIIPHLFINRTIFSIAYIRKILSENLILTKLWFQQRMRYTWQVLYRKTAYKRYF